MQLGFQRFMTVNGIGDIAVTRGVHERWFDVLPTAKAGGFP